jgi:hypothetical protein
VVSTRYIVDSTTRATESGLSASAPATLGGRTRAGGGSAPPGGLLGGLLAGLLGGVPGGLGVVERAGPYGAGGELPVGAAVGVAGEGAHAVSTAAVAATVIRASLLGVIRTS